MKNTSPMHAATLRIAYAKPVNTVLETLESTAQGLNETEAQRRASHYGPNELPAAEPHPAWRRYLAHFNDILIYILLFAAALKAIMGDWVELAVIALASIAIATVGFVQEGRANDALASIKSMLALRAQTLRGGEWTMVESTELVPGDIVRLRSGDRVPADMRLITCTGLQVDEAALTGESLPAQKATAPVPEHTGIGDRTSMVYSGTIVTSGTAEAVVTGIGANTEIGHITEMVADVETLATPLTRQLAQLGKLISIVIGAMALVIIVVGTLVHNFDLSHVVSAAIGFAVGAVPEGLPALVTITLALGVQQMAKRQAIARKMASIETLGSVDTICSDKTGTLTQNEMTATVVKVGGETYTVSGTGYAPHGTITHAQVTSSGTAASGTSPQPGTLAPQGTGSASENFSPAMYELLLAAGLTTDAQIQNNESGRWTLVGEPTEGALTTLAHKSGIDLSHYTRVAQIPFESEHKFSATIDTGADGIRTLHVLGAPDRLLARSTTQLRADGTAETLDSGIWEARMAELSAQGLRLLGVAYSAAPAIVDVAEPRVSNVTELTFLGVVGIVDPPRPEVRDAIAQAHAAGVNVTMITGDHVGTATAIARDLGIGNDHEELRALTGAELEEMTQSELERVVPEVDVYARTSPEHKIRIVEALQARGQVVAMTGDGVNDAPSIARANVGVAMGIKGTEATKEAADIVLSDDNFATITAAVEEGRRIYDNIRRSVVFLLPTNGAQSLVVFVAVMLGLALPLEPVQILWINLVTAITLSIPLAKEPAEPGIMKRPPRNADEPLLPANRLWMVLGVSILIGGATLAAYLIVRNQTGDYELARSVAMNALAFGQLAYLFNCRILNGSSFTTRAFTGNRSVWIAAAVLVALQLVLIYVPFMNTIFGTAAMSVANWGLVLLLSAAVFVAVEGVKALSR